MAKQRQLAVTSYVLNTAGRDGETLAMDVACDGPADASRVLLTTSGVHGVEGYCGSGVQCGLLSKGADLLKNAPDTAIVHVHAVNPYGFSYGRRVNEDNIDLNRNFVDFSQALPDKPDYAALHALLLPGQWPPAPANEVAMQSLFNEWGARRAQLAVTGGQHSHADGLFYGGIQESWSNRIFRSVLRHATVQCRRLAWIDIHTGLGPYGVGERIFASNDPHAGLARARRWWGDGVTSVNTGSSTSIPMTGPIQMAVDTECPQVEYTGICLEFGTVPSTQMHQVLRAEQWLQLHPHAPSEQAKQIKADLMAAFYPDADDWREMIWAQSFEACQQAVQGLQSPA
jgi:hypothetical protein